MILPNDQSLEEIQALKKLTSLNVYKNVSSLADLQFVRKLPNLTNLSINSSIDLPDLSFLSADANPRLQQITLTGGWSGSVHKLGDLSSLEGFTNLSDLDLDDWSMSDVTPMETILKNNPSLTINLNQLNLTSAQQTVIQSLTKQFGSSRINVSQ